MNLPVRAYEQIIPIIFAYMRKNFSEIDDITPSFNAVNLIAVPEGLKTTIRFERGEYLVDEIPVIYNGKEWIMA